MAMNDDCLRFTPSRVDGLADVTEVAVFPDRLELCHGVDKKTVIRFSQIARSLANDWFSQLMSRLGWRRGPAYVADRDWFHPPSERFFRFYTTPSLAIYLPDEPANTSYCHTLFRRIQDIILKGGFLTFDLG